MSERAKRPIGKKIVVIVVCVVCISLAVAAALFVKHRIDNGWFYDFKDKFINSQRGIEKVDFYSGRDPEISVYVYLDHTPDENETKRLLNDAYGLLFPGDGNGVINEKNDGKDVTVTIYDSAGAIAGEGTARKYTDYTRTQLDDYKTWNITLGDWRYDESGE